MPYKDLLVHLDDTGSCAKRVDAAIRLAAQHDAHLTGLYLMVEVPLLSYIREYIPPETRATMASQAQARADAALEAFREAAQQSGIAYETRLDQALDTTLPGVLSMHARYADLLVVGQVDPEDPPEVGRDLTEEVLLSSGRPALVVPYIGAPATLGERVVVAWDASREAARAISDAMPLLERARSVLVVSFDPEASPFGHGELAGADVALHLARHGVQVEVQRENAGEIDVGSALLSYVADRGADLLVTGAYAHSRVRELVLGGVTRTMLQSMTVPVLMAH